MVRYGPDMMVIFVFQDDLLHRIDECGNLSMPGNIPRIAVMDRGKVMRALLANRDGVDHSLSPG